MEKTLTKLIIAVFAIAMILATGSQPIQAQFKSGTRKSMADEVAKAIDKAPTRSDGNAWVTCNIEYDESEFRSDGVVIVSNDGVAEIYKSNDEKCVSFNIPVGVHDILTTGWNKNYGIVYVVKEQLEIKGDTTIVFNYADATNAYEAKLSKPNGDIAKRRLITFNSDHSGFKVLDEGNVDHMTEKYYVTIDGIPFTAYLLDMNYDEKGVDNTIHMNPVSDRCQISLCSFFTDETDNYVVKCTTSDMTDSAMKNNIDDYVLYQEQFTPTVSSDYPDGDGKQLFGMTIKINDETKGALVGMGYSPADKGLVSVNVNAPKDPSTKGTRFDVQVTPVFGDKEYVDDLDSSRKEYGSIEGLPAYVGKDAIQYENLSYDMASNPAFSYSKGQKDVEYGQSVPIVAMLNQNAFSPMVGGKMSVMQVSFLGRLGEVRSADKRQNLTTKVTYNDDVVICEDIATMQQDFETFATSGNADGVIRADFTSENVMVDGLKGKNTTSNYSDWRKEDWTAPALQMLWFKSNDGTITDRFNTPDEAILEFAGADLEFITNGRTSYFECKEQTAEASYAPYSSSDWKPLQVSRIDEYYAFPGFGYFYRAGLDAVKGEAIKGWFDLKVKLTDTAGNYQEQIISPAFKIESMSSAVDEITTSSDVAVEAVWTVDGMQSDKIEKGLNIVKYSDGTVKKIIVK